MPGGEVLTMAGPACMIATLEPEPANTDPAKPTPQEIERGRECYAISHLPEDVQERILIRSAIARKAKAEAAATPFQD